MCKNREPEARPERLALDVPAPEVRADTIENLTSMLRHYGGLEQDVATRTDQRAGVLVALSGVLFTLTANYVLKEAAQNLSSPLSIITICFAAVSIVLMAISAFLALRVLRNQKISAIDAENVVQNYLGRSALEASYGTLSVEVQHYANQRSLIKKKGERLTVAVCWSSVSLATVAVSSILVLFI